MFRMIRKQVINLLLCQDLMPVSRLKENCKMTISVIESLADMCVVKVLSYK